MTDDMNSQTQGELGMSGTLSVRIKIQLEGHFWELANSHAAKAEELKGTSAELREAAGAIVMSAVCLESFINGDLIEQGASPDLLWKTLETKWHTATKSFGDPIDKGQEPFQSFHWLVQLRNYVVHFVPKFEPLVQSGTSQISPVEKKITAETAARAVQAAKALLEDYAARQGREWPWPRSDSPSAPD